MSNKRYRWVLAIGFAVWLCSIIAILVDIVTEYHALQVAFPGETNDSIQAMNGFAWAVEISVLMLWIPFLGAELSCMRSVYKMLSRRPRGMVKLCYLVSVCIGFLVVAFQCLTSLGWLRLEDVWDITNATFTAQAITQWPGFVVSWILGSIPIKQDQ